MQFAVMPALVTGIDVGTFRDTFRTGHRTSTWMAGTSPAMTEG